MDIFVLEDAPARNERFTEMFIDHTLVICNHVDMTLNILDNHRFEYIFLDHDLGGDDPDFNNGFLVAENIMDTANNATPIIIHSFNPSGAQMMKNVLKSDAHQAPVVYAPFGTSEFEAIIERMLGGAA
jgi:hypothetical protein